MDISAAMTLRDVRLWYLQKYKVWGHSYHTADKTQRGFDKLIAAIGDIRVCELTVAHAEQWIEHMHGCGLSLTSIVGYVKQVRPVIHRARALLRRTCPACHSLKAEVWEVKVLRLPKVKRKEIKVYTSQEAHALLASADEPLATAIALAMTTFLRRGTLFNVIKSDIDLERGELRVTSKQDDLLAGTWAFEPKTVVDRVKPLSAWIIEHYVRPLMARLPQHQPYLLIPPERYEKLRGRIGQMSPSLCGNPVPHMNSKLNALFAKAGVEKKQGRAFHSFKAFCVTEALHGGMSPQDVGALADHASPNTTMEYYAAIGGARTDQAREIFENLGPDVGVTGLEPATSRPPAERSTKLSHTPNLTVHRYSTLTG